MEEENSPLLCSFEGGGWRGVFSPDVQRSPWPAESPSPSKQETPEIYFYLVLSLLSLVSVENESGFHQTP